MTTCEYFQAKLLHHLYSALDDEDERDLRSHVSGCSSCRAALDRAREQRQILAEAAKSQFPEVRFAAPATGATPTPRSAGEPTQVIRRPKKVIPWALYALAMSVLLAVVGGLLGYVGYQQRQTKLAEANALVAQANANLAETQTALAAKRARLEKEITEVQEEIRKITEAWDKETSNVRRTFENKQVQVIITGPKNLQAGARNTYQFELQHRNRGGVAPMLAQVVNPVTKQVLFERAIANQQRVDIDLPIDLPVAPGASLELVLKEDGGKNAPVQFSEPLPLLASMYMTHLATDRPMYRPGETVRFRSVTLQRFSLKPADDDFVLQYRITNPSGAEVYRAENAAKVALADVPTESIKGPDGAILRGLGAGEFQLDAELVGGEYTLHVSETSNRFPAEKRKFIVNRYQAPRLNKEIEFTRKSYGAGEEVVALCKVARAEGGAVITNQPAIATLRVDANEQQQELQTKDGMVVVKFKLPEVIERGEASLAVQFVDGGNMETIVRPVPVVLKKLFVDFYPEGGDLVAGVPNRVYFQVHTTLGKPAELRGRIVDEDGKAVVQVQTLNDDVEAGVNQGMGVFALTPAAGKKYELKIDSPIGIESKHLLPQAKAEGIALTIPDGVVEDRIAIELHNGAQDRKLLVGAYCRGRMLDSSKTIDIKKGETRALALNTMAGVSGVYRVTVFDVTGKQPAPVAERLIYRRPVEKLNLKIAANREVFAPGEKVKVTIDASNEKQQSTPAILMVSVVDLSVLKLADEKTARGIPAHFYMTTEVKNPEELEYADFLVSNHPKAEAALDLLLGTQGWRRFAEQNPVRFVQEHQAEATRILTASGQGVERRVELDKLAQERVDRTFAPKLLELNKTVVARNVEQQLTFFEMQNKQNVMEGEINTANNTVHQSASDLRRYQQLLPLWFGIGGGMLMFILGIGAIAVGVARVATAGPNAIGYVAGGAVMLVVVVLGGGVGMLALMLQPMAFERGNIAMHAADAERAEVRHEQFAMPMEAAPGMAMPDAAVGGGLPPIPFPRAVPAAEKAELPQVRLVPPPRGFGQAGQGGNIEDPNFKQGIRAIEGERQQARERLLEPLIADHGGRGMRDMDMAGAPGMPMMDDRFGLMQDARLANLDPRLQQDLMPIMFEPFVARVYAHQRKSSADDVRQDFTETLYWHPVVVLGDGRAEFSFDLSDSVTRFQVLAAGNTLDGRLGSETLEIASRLPFSLEPKVPFEVTNTDRIMIPVTVANDTTTARNVKIDVHADGLTALGKSAREISVAGEKRVRQLFQFQPSKVDTVASLRFSGDFGPFARDTVERKFKVVAEGFPASIARSDMLEGVAIEEITLPNTWVPGTLECKVQVFPSTLADLQKGLDALLGEPGGCFEQSSTTNYPNVLILNYLQQSEQTKPEIEARARGLLKNGYSLLTSYECMKPEDQKTRRGYEWFGQTAPPHEALTAYGLLQFRDMARVFPVDEKMIERTRQYLFNQRDGKGGFKRNPQALDSFGRAPDHITNAYIVWSLTEGGDKEDLKPELDALAAKSKESKDPYFLSLVGISLLNTNRTQEGVDVLTRLKDLQKEDGQLAGAQTSITCSGGRDLDIEATALAAFGWLKANRPGDFQTSIQKAVSWIGKQRGGYGGFGSTQSTILALKALIAHAHANRKTSEAGELALFIDDQKDPIHKIDFPAGSIEPLVVSVPSDKLDQLKPGKNKLRVEMTGKNAFPYTLSMSYRTRQPANAAECPVHLKASLDRNQAKEGETVRVKAVVENRSGKGQGMVVAILGLPAGLTIPENFAQLKDMARLQENGTKPGKIGFFEVRGRELVIYWRDMAPDQKYEVDIDLICRIPGEFRGPASRAYLYYNADNKYWTEPLAMTINPGE